MKNLFQIFLLAALVMVAILPGANAQPVLSTLYGEKPNQYTSLDTTTGAGYNIKTWKFTDLVKQSLTFSLVGKKVGAGNMGGTWYINGSINGGTGWYLVGKITIANADSTYGFTIPNVNPQTYYQTVVQDTGSGNKSYRTYSFYR